MGETIKNLASNKIYLSDPEEKAPASASATFLLWLLLAIAALVTIFLP